VHFHLVFACRIDIEKLPLFERQTLHRIRHESIYRGPILLCPKASFQSGAEEGRYSAAISDQDLLYTESFYGISFANQDAELAPILSAILNSCQVSLHPSLKLSGKCRKLCVLAVLDRRFSRRRAGASIVRFGRSPACKGRYGTAASPPF
jgi:hypothetical protein